MLRRTIRELSAKNANPRAPCVRRRRPRLLSRIAHAFAFMLTVTLTSAGWAVPHRSHCGVRPGKTGLMQTVLAFSGYG